jgi:hypothetical protein
MDFLEMIAVPAPSTFNIGLAPAKNADMLNFFGHPVKGGAYRPDGKCTDPDVAAFKAKVATKNVGPFKATGLVPALESLTAILARVKNEVPELFAILKSDGMLCARFTKIRQPNGTIKIGPGISNHSWGTAIDIKLGAQSDTQGDDKVLRGLLILSTYFNSAGWYWGAAFPTEDSMHFEVSKGLLNSWKKAGTI